MALGAAEMEVTDGLGTLCPDTKNGVLWGSVPLWCPASPPEGGTRGSSGEEPLLAGSEGLA